MDVFLEPKTVAAERLCVTRQTLNSWLDAGVMRPARRDRHRRHDTYDPSQSGRARDVLVRDDVWRVADAIADLPHSGNDNGQLADAARQAFTEAVAARTDAIRLPDGTLPAYVRDIGQLDGPFCTVDCPACWSETDAPGGLVHRGRTELGETTCAECGERLTVLHPGTGPHPIRIRS